MNAYFFFKGNEIVQTIFNELVKDHFLLSYETSENDPKPKKCLVNLCDTCPIFSSLFITIVLDMHAKLGNQDKCIRKLFELFEIWISKNKLLPLLAYKSNITHACSYLLNPLPSLFYVTVIYPFISFTNSFDLLAKNIQMKLIKLEKRSVKSETNPMEEKNLIVKQEFATFQNVKKLVFFNLK
jgi:hypothetical protein